MAEVRRLHLARLERARAHIESLIRAVDLALGHHPPANRRVQDAVDAAERYLEETGSVTQGP